MKNCKSCRLDLPVGEFYAHKGTKDRLTPRCKKCICAASNARYANLNEEQKAAAAIKRKEWDEKNKEKSREIKRSWQARNRERHNAQAVEWYWRDPERSRAFFRSCYQRNPERWKANHHRYRAMKSGSGGSFTQAEWVELCNKHGNRCLRCGEEKKMTADHVIPVSKGGTSNIDNIQPLCLPCNIRKGAKTIDYRGSDVLQSVRSGN